MKAAAVSNETSGAAVDPVCGMKVEPQRARAEDHGGHTYFFCSAKCADKFRADPLAYLRPVTPAIARADDRSAAYTCPMHPEVTRDGPGACPICGMALEPRVARENEGDDPELVDMTRRFWASLPLAAIVFLFGMADLVSDRPLMHALPAPWLPRIELVVTTPVVLWGGWPFFVRGWESVVRRRLNMFTLIALGTGAAYLFSVVATLIPSLFPASSRGHDGAVPVYFEPAAVITVLVLLGQVIELRARSRTGSAVRALLGLTPKIARQILPDGREEDVPLERIERDDRLRVRPGEKVPVDGVVLEGTSTVDESMMTGEPRPITKSPGARLMAGSLNGTGGLVMRAERVGKDTLLAQIIAVVSEAQRSKPEIQQMADVVSSYFVPAVIVAAMATFAVWATVGPEPRMAHALVNAVAVLIIACPCALGLATPMSVVVGVGRGATMGVLFKSAHALEILHTVDTLVVDKTGTLTLGRPRVVEIVSASEASDDELLALAAGVERGSEHPLAQAIVEAATERGLAFPAAVDFQAIAGQGVTGQIDGQRRVSVGNARLVGLVPPSLEIAAERLRRNGQTVTFVGVEGVVRGLISIADPIKPHAAAVIRELQAEGIRVIVLTGDSRTNAEAVARALGVDQVEADVLPTAKGEVIARLKAQGHKVAMAGDGINDAPALAEADVGIAMGTGTDIAIQSAGVVLVQGDLRGIQHARALSRATMRNIRQNLVLAFFYNALGVPIAAGALYPVMGLLLSPMVASAAMSLSSVSVIVNALRLRNTRT